jgi:hypothetical protein
MKVRPEWINAMSRATRQAAPRELPDDRENVVTSVNDPIDTHIED